MKTSDTSGADNIIPGNATSRNCASDKEKAKDLLPGDNVQDKSLTESHSPGSNSSEISREDKMHLMDVFNSIDFDKIIDHPNILIAAHFWDEERYRAAKICYWFMRAVDDLVDNYRSEHKVITPDERAILEQQVKKWIEYAVSATEQKSDSNGLIGSGSKGLGESDCNDFGPAAGNIISSAGQLVNQSCSEHLPGHSSGQPSGHLSEHTSDNFSNNLGNFIHTLSRFLIPLWPFEVFARSMIYDIHHEGFPTFESFLDYSAGASVAPASIFVHLCGLKKVEAGCNDASHTKVNGTDPSGGSVYTPPEFDVKRVAYSCAIFSYIVHIIRDFVKDHTNNLNYFPLDLMGKYGLDREGLLKMAKGEKSLTPGFRKMISELYSQADIYRLKTLEILRDIEPLVEPRSRLSLRIIFDLYTMVFERIDPENGSFTTAELNPTAGEIKARVWRQLLSA